MDTESPLMYEFSYGNAENQTIFLYRSKPSGVNISVTDWLIAGDKIYNHTLTVQFTVKDSLGSKAVQSFDVQVNHCTTSTKRRRTYITSKNNSKNVVLQSDSSVNHINACAIIVLLYVLIL